MAICSRCGNKWKMSELNTCPVCKEKRDKQRDRDYDNKARNKSSYEVYHSSDWKKLKKKILIRDGFQCVRCRRGIGIKPKDHVTDHIIPMTKGGAAYDSENLQSLCVRCHGEKRSYE